MTVTDGDPFGTIRNALWIGGGQWAGKSTVARLLARGGQDAAAVADTVAGHFRPYLPIST